MKPVDVVFEWLGESCVDRTVDVQTSGRAPGVTAVIIIGDKQQFSVRLQSQIVARVLPGTHGISGVLGAVGIEAEQGLGGVISGVEAVKRSADEQLVVGQKQQRIDPLTV